MASESEAVARNVKRLRRQSGWTAAELAQRCADAGALSLTRSTIAKIESGVRKAVTADELAVLAAVFRVEPGDLLSGSESEPLSNSGVFSWLRRRRTVSSADGPGRDEIRCPACGSDLSGAVPVDEETGRFVRTPSFFLEVGLRQGAEDVTNAVINPATSSAAPWRVRMMAGNYPPAESSDPQFNPYAIAHDYVLCGDGHFFLRGAEAASSENPQPPRFDRWNVAAMIGGPASGKTYILARALAQHLVSGEGWRPPAARRIRTLRLSPLEQTPWRTRAEQYQRTFDTGEVIVPTGVESSLTPIGILQGQLGWVTEAIRELIYHTVLDGARTADRWGSGIRQPIVIRTDDLGEHVWNGIVDLPGELFLDDLYDQAETIKLPDYQKIVWVVDPALAHGLLERVAEHSAEGASAVHDGSLRPGSTGFAGFEVVRQNRERIQQQIARQLAVSGGPLNSTTPGPHLLVTLSKCDLVRAHLEFGTLDEFGVPGSVSRGASAYLAAFADRAGDLGNDGSAIATGSAMGQLLAAADYGRIGRLADALISHYSNPTAFWNLVHVGDSDAVIFAHPPGAVGTVPLTVPSISEHLDAALDRSSDVLRLPRDVVMSAIGCGLAYALGLDAMIFEMLQDTPRLPTFYLCSALGATPAAIDDFAIRPIGQREAFSDLYARSAGLTQLALAILRT